MECPKCQFDNPEDRKFCGECGARMERICPQCYSSNPCRHKFCGECGQRLTKPDKKETAVALESERKHATVLFSDLVGYTAMTEKLDPEDVKEIMSRIFGEIAQVVAKYEGFIERFFGDEVMALFGVPKAHEDDPVRAIRAAWKIHRAVEEISPRYEAQTGHPLAMHTGINTGLLITGDEYIGKGRHGLTGDTVNLAARLTKLAKPGEILVGQETYARAEGYFIFDHLQTRQVKGKAQPVKAYQVIAPSTRRTRFEVSADRGLTPLVGREPELQQLMTGFERCKKGEGGAFSIVSEAGFGKSRLLYEFRKAVAREEAFFLEGKCLSYGKGAAYHPVIDILKSVFDITEDDSDSEVREKVVKGLKMLKTDEESTLPYLLELLSVKESGLDQMVLSPEGKKDRIIQALKKIVIQGSGIRPLILSVEDLHWVDSSSEDVFKDLLNSLSGTRVLLIFTYRPRYTPTWGIKSFHHQINLNRFSEEESLSMLTSILGTPNIDAALADLITQKTEGAPFFMEELIKSLKALKAIEKKDKYYLAKNIDQVAIPSTIQDIIMARVDLLAEDAKGVLQTGSVIEREFSYALIGKVTGLPEKTLLSHLAALRDSELVYERGIFPQSSYIFKHALTRDVVYGSILKKKRKKLHGQIGDVIEELYKDHINRHYGVIADHCIAAENYEKGMTYSSLEARKQQKASAFKNAIEYQQKCISCLGRMNQTEEIQKKDIDARTTLSIYHLSLSHYSEAKEVVEPVMELALKLNYRKRLPGIYTAMGLHALWVEEDFSSGTPYINNSIRMSEEIGDFLSAWLANFHLSMPLSYQCEFEKALSHIEKCLDLSKLADNPSGILISKAAIAQIYYMEGNIGLACQLGKEASHLAKGSDDGWSKGWAHAHYGCALYYKGVIDKAEKYLLDGLTYSRQTSLTGGEAWAAFTLGNICLEMGKYEEAKKYYIIAAKALEAAKILPSWINTMKICSARAGKHMKGANTKYHDLFKCFEKNKLKVCEGIMAMNIGDILLQSNDGQMVDSEAWIKKAIYADTKYGTKWHLATDHALYAEWFKKKGDLSGAREQLTRAIEIFRECGADGWVEKYEGELALLTPI
jgi:class 3 adenylate cyclase/tetratricopeptide (TPR) repeat protein